MREVIHTTFTSVGVFVIMGHFSSTLASVSEATRSMVAAVMKMVLTLSYKYF